MAILYMKIFTAFVPLLPFFAEGARGLDLSPNLEPRQSLTFSPTTEANPLPTQSPIIVLNDFLNPLETCTHHVVTWTYAGPPLPLSLTVTNAGVIQEDPPSSTPTRPTNTLTDVRARAVPSGASGVGTINTELTEATDPRGAGFSWNVNVPQGWYQLVAKISSTFATQSQPFYVHAGSDQSCLITPSPSSSSSTSPLPSPAPGQTTSPVPPPSQSSPPASKDSRIGVIVGVVAGAIVFLILVLIAYLCLRRRKNALDRPVSGQIGGAHLSRGWGGLGSQSSVHARKAPVARNVSHRSTMDSTGGLFMGEDRRNSTFSPFEEKHITSPVSYTKNPFDDAEGGLALATLPSSGDRAAASRSSVHLGQLPSSQQHSSTTVDTAFLFDQGYTQGSSSIDPSPRSSMQPGYSNLSSPFIAKDMTRSYSSSTGAASSADTSHQQKKNASHQPTGPQPTTARKTPRKPVPAYDPSLPSAISTSVTTSTGSSSPSPATPISASVASSSHGHYAKKSRAATGVEGSHELLHKSSFGPGGVEGKPVHYLIPDMPQSGKF